MPRYQSDNQQLNQVQDQLRKIERLLEDLRRRVTALESA